MAMPARERAMFLLLGYAANQVAFYSKLTILSTNYNSADEVENTLSAAQSLMIVRTVAGVLHETWDGIIRKALPQLAGGPSIYRQHGRSWKAGT